MNTIFRLKDFDGPLDLLLTLVNRAQIDIREIFVSEITDQYLEIVRSAPDLDMDEASDFLVIAATLVEIKSRAMLPRPPEVEEGEEDPETELIRRLEEYRRYKESAVSLRDFEEAAKNVFTKLPEEYPLPPREVELTGLTLEGLTAAFLRIWERHGAEEEEERVNHYAPRDIHRDVHTVQECMLTLLQRLKKKGRMKLEEAFSESPTKEEVVTFFLAVLELLKLGRMHAEQHGVYGEIELIAGRVKTEPVEEEPNPKEAAGRKRRKKDGKPEPGTGEKPERGKPEPETGKEPETGEETEYPIRPPEEENGISE